MTTVIRVIETALPVLVAIVIGMVCRQKNFIGRDGIEALKKVVTGITLPAVLFSAFAEAEYSLKTISLPALVFALCFGALGVGIVLAKILRLPGKIPPYLATGFEAGMLGYALFALLYPKDSASNFAILDLGQTLFVFIPYKILLSGKNGIKAVVKDIFTSPIMWAIIAGVLFGSTGLYGALDQIGVGSVISSLSDFIAAPTAMIILLTVGYDLVLREIKWSECGRYIVLRLVPMALMLGLLIAVNRLLLGCIIHEGAAALLFILPPPYVLPIFADDPQQRSSLSSALSALTFVTIVLFSVMTVVVR